MYTGIQYNYVLSICIINFNNICLIARYFCNFILLGSKKIIRRGTEWEIVEGLKDGQRYDKKPDIFKGYLHKKRKWPLKGWHKV